jgi:predicted PurR-regulated permease PerM
MNNFSTKNSIYDTIIRLIILLSIISCSLLIMAPFANIILWSLLLAIAFYSFHKSLSEKIGNRPKLASFIIVASILFIFILPMGFLLGSIADDVKEIKVGYEHGSLTIPAPNTKVKEWPIIGEKVYTNWYYAFDDTKGYISKNQDQIIAIGGTIVKGILGAVSGIVQIAISLIIAGVLLTFENSGESIRKFFRKVGGDRGDEFANLTVKTISSVIKGILGEGVLLAILHGIVFLLSGVPYPGLWTLLVFIFAIMQLPVFFLTVPIIVYFFSVNETVFAIMWSVFLLLATFSDNILTPLLLGKGAPVPMAVMFIGVLGGFVLFGFIGLFTGAIVLALGYNLLISWINTEKQVNPQ